MVWQQPRALLSRIFHHCSWGLDASTPENRLRKGTGVRVGECWLGVGAGGCLSTPLMPLEGQVHLEHQQHHGSGELSHSQAGVLTSLCLSFLNCQLGANTIHPRVVVRIKGDDVLSREDGMWAGGAGGPKSRPTWPHPRHLINWGLQSSDPPPEIKLGEGTVHPYAKDAPTGAAAAL